MALTIENLDAIRLDALKEVGNIGAGNAMTALAEMVDSKVDMSVPRVGILPLREFVEIAGGPESLSVGVYLPVTGDAPGHVAFLMPIESALRLSTHLLGMPGTPLTELDDMALSALTEVGNILTSSYIRAIGELTGLELVCAPPMVAMDMTAAILSAIIMALPMDSEHVLTIVTEISEVFSTIEGFFIYIPEPGSLPTILHALQLEG
jgi:chemotaxis protein CheC